MKIREMVYRLYIPILAVVILSMAAGCGRAPGAKDPGKGGSTIADIGGYKLTVNDFRDEARLVAPNMAASPDPEKAKEMILNELITKKILLKEAQAQNFDKDKNFMKEIERYWEQALLKLLMKKKIDEFSRAIPPGTGDDMKQKMLQSELTRWIGDARGAVKVKVYRENLKGLDIK